MKLIALLLLALLIARAQHPPFSELVSLFDYDRAEPVNEKIRLREERAGVRIYEYSFGSSVAGRVPGLLVLPPDKAGTP